MEQVAKAIGYLVYAVARADKHVSPEEKKIVHDIVNEHWKILADKEDPFGVRAVDFIDKLLLVLEEKKIDSNEAYNQFCNVFSEQRILFTPELIQFTLNICIQTGSVFNRMNKSELVLLSRIENVLKTA